MLFFPDRAGWGYGSVWAEGSAWQASGLRPWSLRKGSFPSGGGWLVPRLKKMPYLYDNKDAEFLNQFKLLLTGQYQGLRSPLPEPTGSARALMAGKTNGGGSR